MKNGTTLNFGLRLGIFIHLARPRTLHRVSCARAETLVPRGADPPKRKPEEEPTFKLRRKMGLV